MLSLLDRASADMIADMRRRGQSYGEIETHLGISRRKLLSIYRSHPQYLIDRKIGDRISKVRWPKEAFSSLAVPTPEVLQFRIGPVVYVLLSDNDSPLYVGCSSKGLHRILNRTSQFYIHTRRGAELLAKKALLYWVKTEKQMLLLEAKLMMELRPKYNLPQLSRSVAINGIVVERLDQ